MSQGIHTEYKEERTHTRGWVKKSGQDGGTYYEREHTVRVLGDIYDRAQERREFKDSGHCW